MINGPRIMFLGSKAAGLRICRRLVELLPEGILAAIICPDDRDDPRSVCSDYLALADAAGVPVHIAATKAEAIGFVRKYGGTTVVVHGWYSIIGLEELAESQFFGFHYSPLPRYRGNAPLVWQILSGECEVGVSLFELTAEMDSGRLFDQRLVALGPDETIADALMKIDTLAEDMVGAFVQSWFAGSVPLRDQPDGEASYCGLRTSEDGLIDWNESGERIHNFVRAQTRPYPGAFARLPDGRRLTIWKTSLEERSFLGVPGGIAEVSQDYVVVTAGAGAVRVVEVQVEGDAPLPAKDVLRSLRLRLR